MSRPLGWLIFVYLFDFNSWFFVIISSALRLYASFIIKNAIKNAEIFQQAYFTQKHIEYLYAFM